MGSRSLSVVTLVLASLRFSRFSKPAKCLRSAAGNLLSLSSSLNRVLRAGKLARDVS